MPEDFETEVEPKRMGRKKKESKEPKKESKPEPKEQSLPEVSGRKWVRSPEGEVLSVKTGNAQELVDEHGWDWA